MKKFISLSFLSLFALTISCNSNDDDFSQQQKEIIINNVDLSKRITNDGLGVIGLKESPDENPENETNAKIGSFGKVAVENDIAASHLPLIKIAEVSAPTYQGTTLRATHVAIEGDYAYVSFNVEGDQYLGAIDVINISDPNNPIMELEAIFPNTDISAVSYYNNTLYLAGATNATAINESNPAVLMKIELDNGIPTEDITLIDMPSYVATDVFANTNGVYGVSGNTGIVGQYDHNSSNLNQQVSLGDLRAIGNYDSKIIVLSGTEGVHIYNETNLSEINSIETNTDIADSKRTIDFYDNNVLVSEGKNGMVAYDLTNGNEVATIDLPIVSGLNIDQNEVVTNAVTVENDHVFIANGAAGLAVHNITTGLANITSIGTLEIDGSTNYVKSANGYIFVASGNGGLKIIKTIVDEPNNESTSITCSGPEFSAYTGGSWMNINSNETKYYTGSTSLQGLNINAELTFCGSLAVSSSLNVNSNAHFKMSGTLSQGNTLNKYLSLNINNGAILELEGSMTVYGNMIFNSGATLKVLGSVTIYGDVTIQDNVNIEFLGTDSSITIHGNVTKNGTPTISGDYNDTLNKL